MHDWLARQTMLIGLQATQKLDGARVAIIGVGGVGGAALEGVVRCGVGNIMAMDYDVFDITNLNRQILAFTDTVGVAKVDIAAARARGINPGIRFTACNEKFGEQTAQMLLDFQPDFVVDAIDMVSAKLALIAVCKANGIPVVSSMGTGNRLNAEHFTIGDIADTAGCGCPLARVMRRELRKRGIGGVPVLYGKETPLAACSADGTPGSVSFVPPVAGYLLAGYVVRSLLAL